MSFRPSRKDLIQDVLELSVLVRLGIVHSILVESVGNPNEIKTSGELLRPTTPWSWRPRGIIWKPLPLSTDPKPFHRAWTDAPNALQAHSFWHVNATLEVHG
jgi:hypothetical protein